MPWFGDQQKQARKLTKDPAFFIFKSSLSCEIALSFYKENICGKRMIGKKGYKLSPDQIQEKLKSFLLNFDDTEMEPELAEPYDRFGRMKYVIMMVILRIFSKK